MVVDSLGPLFSRDKPPVLIGIRTSLTFQLLCCSVRLVAQVFSTMEPPRDAVLGRWVNGELFVNINGAWRPVWLTMPMNVGAARILQGRRMVEDDSDDDPRIVMCSPHPPTVVAPRPKQRPVQAPVRGQMPPTPPPAVHLAS